MGYENGSGNDIESLILDVEACHLDLSEWETTFIRSIRQQFDAKRKLSEKQEKTLRKIHEEKT